MSGMQQGFSNAPMRALVIDGDRVSREYLELVLHHAGYNVRTASQAPVAFRTMENFRPELVLIATDFSESGGFSVLRRLIEIARRLKFESRCVMLSREERSYEREQAASVGAVDYIVKPVQPGHLRRRLHEAMRQEALV